LATVIAVVVVAAVANSADGNKDKEERPLLQGRRLDVEAITESVAAAVLLRPRL